MGRELDPIVVRGIFHINDYSGIFHFARIRFRFLYPMNYNNQGSDEVIGNYMKKWGSKETLWNNGQKWTVYERKEEKLYKNSDTSGN